MATVDKNSGIVEYLQGWKIVHDACAPGLARWRASVYTDMDKLVEINSPWFPLDLHPFRNTNIRAVHNTTMSALLTRSFWRLLDSRCLICEV
jgi:hypothetical protein